jgi:hypothetical protein
MKATAALLVATIAALLSGCESTPHYNRTKVVTLIPGLPKKPYGSVRLYQDKSELPAAYDVISILTVEGSAGDEAAFIKAFLYRAADEGADGLILYRGNVAAGVEGGGFILNRNGGFGMPGKLSQDAVFRGEAIRTR